MPRYVIKKRTKSGHWIYYNNETHKFDTKTFSLYQTLAETSMILLHCERKGYIENVEISDIQIQEVEL